MMQILIIGGTNFIGPPVVHHLIAMGHEVTLFHRGETKADLPTQVQHVLGDRLHLFDFKREFERIAPQVVLDMIPYTEQDAQDVIKTFKGIARRVVAISSQDVYRAYDVFRLLESGPIDPIPLTEDSPLRDRLYPYRGLLEHPFDRSDDYEKILIERMVMTTPDLAGTIVRLPMVYGSGDFRHRLFPLLKRMDEQRPAIVLEESFARWQGCHGYVENVAYAIVLAVTQDQASGRIYNVAEPSAVSEAERIRAIGRIAGWQGEVIVVPKSQMPESWELPYNTAQAWACDSTRIREELGYSELILQDEALKRTIAWQRTHPPNQSAQGADSELLDYAAEDVILAALK